MFLLGISHIIFGSLYDFCLRTIFPFWPSFNAALLSHVSTLFGQKLGFLYVTTACTALA
jgi:uncharacterized membrane protein YdjX (TVP38/TMEM64 family)